ncbi:unnamed protein product [Clonostachys chloroleuca]|uniref:Branched-chain-amino-acid aminotransferase n=1 Tax=Clonostachys chloroleuca TaxID=1926264 RepID=A0AA35MHW2_9HYPO|nr:unnamed protein product [Clonostachys chloroleuca]
MAPSVDKSNGVTENGNSVKEMNSSSLIKDLIPEDEQSPVPGLDDPVRMTQNATTAHILTAKWTIAEGWAAPEIKRYGNIELPPTASVLHYATSCFEGMKAYRGFDNKLRLFRPWLNCARMRDSNERVSLPDFDPEELLKLISTFVATEGPRWLPDTGSTFYVRPAMVGSGSALGINRPGEALFFVFAALFPQSRPGTINPGIRLITSQPSQIRAWPGGFGNTKVGANYGPAMTAQVRARQNECSQTLWLFGDSNIVTEAGASNFFVIWRRSDNKALELVTCSDETGVILNGITRRSVLEIARERLGSQDVAKQVSGDLDALDVIERPFSIDEVVKAHQEERLIEAFVSGTAMFISPVSQIIHEDKFIDFPTTENEAGQKVTVSKYAKTIKLWLEDIIYGREEHPWAFVVDETRDDIAKKA